MRAPGSDQNTMLALRRDQTSAESFPEDGAEDHDDAVRQMTIAYRARTRAMISRGSVGGTFTDAEIDAFPASPNGRRLTGEAFLKA
ncbi:hypothetical protein [Actinoplanes sp. NPDC049599]|uniref:hypothetical protein n=1 Tax=Actinoplanes sp. NPDC049599 TaxID=3363903 RepID=UPI00379FC824